MNIESLRKEYKRSELRDDTVNPDPVKQFRSWFEEAMHADIDEVNAITLATADTAGRPSARIVLLKAFDKKGFTFFTNYEGRKSRDLKENPQAALLMFWKELERQIRIEGRVEVVPAKESDKYFDSRSLESRISAAISPQSEEVPSRRHLEELWIKKLKELKDNKLLRPESWGGYRVIPDQIEFWQGRPNRLHDRILYSKQGSKWVISRLAP
jgi:pyridoxamine 5'-phosphate oxidase